ncbi:MAG: hypothetical protein ACOYMS_15655 [Terrimicrobiaceae bacterium]
MNDTRQPRPPLLRALGSSEPPDEVRTDGLAWKLVEVFKHDSWAATALYQCEERRIVVKFNRQQPVLCFSMVWLGRWLAAREARAYERLKDLTGVPRACGAVQVNGRVCSNAFAHDFREGHPLARDERPGPAFFDKLDALIHSMHERGMAYLDLNKRENVIVTEANEPLLVDFQIHLAPPSWLANLPPVRLMMRELQEGDIYHLRKLRTYHTSGPEAMAALDVPLASRIWRWIYVRPVQGIRRRLLVALRIRTGDGLALSELMPEKAVRLARENRARSVKGDRQPSEPNSGDTES